MLSLVCVEIKVEKIIPENRSLLLSAWQSVINLTSALP